MGQSDHMMTKLGKLYCLLGPVRRKKGFFFFFVIIIFVALFSLCEIFRGGQRCVDKNKNNGGNFVSGGENKLLFFFSCGGSM